MIISYVEIYYFPPSTSFYKIFDSLLNVILMSELTIESTFPGFGVGTEGQAVKKGKEQISFIQ